MTINNLFAVCLDDKHEMLPLQYDFYGAVGELLDNELVEEEVVTKILQNLKEKDEEIYVCKNFKFAISDNITNQIIHYKDVFKINEPIILCPYLIYGKTKKENKDYVIILVANNEQGYVYSKGMYYCLTEPNGFMDGYRNNVVALSLDEENYDEVLQSITEIIEETKSLGAVQRYYDRKYLKTVEEMKDMCVEASTALFEEAKEKMLEIEDRTHIIYNTISKCFLLKKCMYVQYMMNKTLLELRFSGSVKKQRQAAKESADAIPFVSFSELWRYQKEVNQEIE